jgi:hypothetical protein
VSPFDGVWTGAIDNSIRVEVRIVDDKAVAYSVKNTPIDIKFSRESGDAIVFGDPDNYVFKLQRSGDATLTARYRDRDGFSRIALSRAQG